MGLFGKMFSGSEDQDSVYSSAIINDDAKYIKFFLDLIGPKIHDKHSKTYFVCCAFCAQLQKSNCHEFCFTCTKRVYPACSSVLPESFSIGGLYYTRQSEEDKPWIFKTPCTSFESLIKKKYFRNFINSNQQITIANFEALESIFMGFCRGRRPCHICASINIKVYNSCPPQERAENRPCGRMVSEIALKYRSIMGMVKYVDK